MRIKMKFLNLDTFAKDERILTIDGVRHSMKEMSVSDYIELNNKAEEMDKGETVSTVQSVEFMIDSITKIFPTLTVDILKQRSMGDLAYISSFARGELDAHLEEQNQEAEKSGAVKKKK